MNLRNLLVSIAILAGGSAAAAQAEDSSNGWLQTRDQNPFVLGSGLPAPPVVPISGRWRIDTTLNIANTELAESRDDAAFVFDAETRESRVSVAYAFDDRWSLRASLAHLWIGAGAFDSTIEHFHHAFGFDNGNRGQLGTQAPVVDVRAEGALLYALDRRKSGIGPTLVDLTRAWRGGAEGLSGFSLGIKFPSGDQSRLSDTGSTDLSLTAFNQRGLGERWTVAARAGVLYQHDNTLLGDRARELVPFASAMLSYRLGSHWSALLQADAHGALYRDLPDFFASANILSFGFSRRVSQHDAVFITLAEDVPALHTADIVLQLGWRMQVGAR